MTLLAYLVCLLFAILFVRLLLVERRVTKTLREQDQAIALTRPRGPEDDDDFMARLP